MSELSYFEKLSAFYKPVRTMTWVTALLVAVSAVFGGINTLYAAFASRVREIATLQAIGFGRLAVLVSFIQESMVAAAVGTLLGALASAALYSERVVSLGGSAFRMSVEPGTLYVGLIAGLFLGLLGALPPAIRCLSPALPAALRDSA